MSKLTWRGAVALAVFSAVFATSLAWAAQPPPAPNPPPDPRDILNGACTMCHGVDFIVEHRKDRDDWDFTVHRMMDKGAELTPDDAALLVDYLAKTYAPAANPGKSDAPPQGELSAKTD